MPHVRSRHPVIGFLSLVALIGVGVIGLLARIGAKRACACAGPRLQRRPTAPIATANSTSRHDKATAKRTSQAISAKTKEGMFTKISNSIANSVLLLP